MTCRSVPFTTSIYSDLSFRELMDAGAILREPEWDRARPSASV